jgi:hypothetical protein
MNNTAKRPSLRLLGEDMDVGGHHAPREKPIAKAIEVVQGVCDQGSDSIINQGSRA